ncbi:MAG: hypothetical protein AABO41_00010 [Acidobacteriota bacterium]
MADNDVIFKLAACDLLDRALHVLGLFRDDVFVLNTIKYQLQKQRSRTKLEAKYGPEGVKRALEFVLSVHEIESEPDPNDLATLVAIEDIDSGEAVIFATTTSSADSILLMGDKRALTALCSADSCSSICARLNGRIFCFEQVISLLCAADFDGAKANIVSALSCDIVLQIAFAGQLDATLEDVNDGLNSYIADLRSKTGELLII